MSADATSCSSVPMQHWRHSRAFRQSHSAPSGAPDVAFPFKPPEPINRDIKLLGRLIRDGVPTIILCDNAGQIERLDELLEGDRFPIPAALTLGVLNGGFLLPPREGYSRDFASSPITRYSGASVASAGRASTRRRVVSRRSAPSRRAITSCISSRASGSIAASRSCS